MTSLLSNSDARTIRQARAAIHLLVSGGIRELEANFGPSDNPDRSVATDALLLHLREEIAGWQTTHEMEDRPAELTPGESSIADADLPAPDGDAG